MKKRILFVDNDVDFLDTRSEELEKSGYEVFKATSIEEAQQLLIDHWVQLAVVDLRLRDDSDDRDVSGLTLAKNEAYHSVPKIILTRYPRFEHVREALGPALVGLPPAVDYLDKREGSEALINTIEQILTKFSPINWNLIVRWVEHNSFLLLTSFIESETADSIILERSTELENLFRQLFSKDTQITIGQLFSKQQGQIILEVFTYRDYDEGHFIVCCGAKQLIKSADARYEALALKDGGQGDTVKANSVETLLFAATAYRLSGDSMESLKTFSEAYKNLSVEAVLTMLNHLFNFTLLPWSQKGQYQENTQNLNDHLSEWLILDKDTITPKNLNKQIDAICKECLTSGLARLNHSAQKLTLLFSDGTTVAYPNLTEVVSEKHLMIEAPFLCGATHSRLDGNSILVNSDGQSWLIDFGLADQGALIRDYVSLETAIKCDLFTTSNLLVRQTLEERLLTQTNLNEKISYDSLEPEAQKSLQAILSIRQYAASILGNELKAYQVGLLLCAIKRIVSYDTTVRHTRHELISYFHSLLSAAMLCQQLAPLPRRNLPQQALNSLWIDEPNKEIWVEGRSVNLSSQEFKFLLFLYQHPNQLCSRTKIAEQVFGVKFDDDMLAIQKKDIEDGRINSTMSRMRRKVEQNPDQPKYITAIRGEGYKLVLNRG